MTDILTKIALHRFRGTFCSRRLLDNPKESQQTIQRARFTLRRFMDHENTAVWTILGAIPAANTQFRQDEDFTVGMPLNSVSGRTVRHAHRILAMSTCYRNEKASEDCSLRSVQTGFPFMRPSTGFDALITAYAFVFIDKQHICTFENPRIH
jgi:hypothetical protein